LEWALDIRQLMPTVSTNYGILINLSYLFVLFPFTTPINIDIYGRAMNMEEKKNIHRLTLDGREIILIGTAHVSKESADLVEKTISDEKPDVVCVELCQARYDAITQKDSWHNTDIVKVIRNKRSSLLLFQLLLASFQKKIAQKFHINPGEEMLRALMKAKEVGAKVILADREIRVTLLRTWRMMKFLNKVKMVSELLISFFNNEEITEEDIEKLKQQDVLEIVMQTIGKKQPELKTTLIDERDQFLAHTIGHVQTNKIIAVVGAGHVSGIIKKLGKDIDIDAINQIPPKGLLGRSLGWGFSLAIIGSFAAGFYYSGSQASLNMIKWWVLITAAFSGLGALIMLAHPITIAASAVAAPVTTLHPLIAAGWVAGLAEATFRKPQVKDFLNLQEDITNVKGFFRNKITRILLLIAFVNLTTSIGTFVAIPVIMRYL
jgi:pheromone shutdown-related protein TraB